VLSEQPLGFRAQLKETSLHFHRESRKWAAVGKVEIKQRELPECEGL
jgi:hypothetical protein